ncbi:hypothetical protein NDU88_001660 [Pleurodeles waltl]|uniref:Uncharacterized protein n=1 Tax=Pleurodeles waltl TaxID=8319 RepID=A0AAV7M0B4_PLEWA|nr:hypothetical protein NDU88_001660 [Pleurodeles waltl]
MGSLCPYVTGLCGCSSSPLHATRDVLSWGRAVGSLVAFAAAPTALWADGVPGPVQLAGDTACLLPSRAPITAAGAEHAKKGPLLHQGSTLFMFPDFNLTVHEASQKFSDAKNVLQKQGLKYSMLYPDAGSN